MRASFLEEVVATIYPFAFGVSSIYSLQLSAVMIAESV